MRRFREVAVAAVVLLAVGSVGAVSAGASIGGPPANDLVRCDRYSKPCGKPFVVAEGTQYGGAFEIVGMTSRLGSCLSFERPGDVFSVDTPCDEDVSPRPKRPLRVELLSLSGGIGEPWITEIGGVLRPDVARVRIVFRRGTELRRKDAISNQLDIDLARAIGFKRRVGVFALQRAGPTGSPGKPEPAPQELRCRRSPAWGPARPFG